MDQKGIRPFLRQVYLAHSRIPQKKPVLRLFAASSLLQELPLSGGEDVKVRVQGPVHLLPRLAG